MLNVSLIGAGFIGRVHARCIAANAATRLAAVYDLDESAASALAAQHGARVAKSIGEITGSDETDAVAIASAARLASFIEVMRDSARMRRRRPAASRASQRDSRRRSPTSMATSPAGSGPRPAGATAPHGRPQACIESDRASAAWMDAL